MAEGITWQVDIPVKSESAKTADQTVGKLEASLKKTEVAAERAGKKTEESFKGIGKSVNEAHEKVHGFLETIGAIAAFEGLKSIAEHFADIGKEAIKSAAHAERMKRVIDVASGGKEAGAENRNWLEEFAKKNEFSDAQAESAFVAMKRVGASDRSSKTAILAAADVAAVSANKDEAFEAATSAFARLQRTGKVSNRTLAPLGLGEKDFSALDEFKGMSKKQIQKQMDQGEVTQDQLMRLIMAHTGETAIGERAADQADLLGTKLSKLSELPERFYKKLADTSAMKTLTRELDGILEKLDPDSPTGKKISEFLTGALTEAGTLAHELGEAIDNIDFDELADTIKTEVVPAIREMVHLIQPAMEAVTTTVRGLGIAAHFLSGRKTSEEQAGADAAFEANRAAASGGSIWAQIKNPFLRAAAGKDHPHRETVEGDSMAYRRGKAIGDGVAAGIEASSDDVKSAAAEHLVDAPDQAVREKAQIESPSKLFEEHGENMGEGLARGLEGSSSRIDDAMDSTLDVSRFSPTAAIGGVSVTMPITIHVEGGSDGAEQGRRAADAFMKEVRPAVVSVLEQMAAERGAR